MSDFPITPDKQNFFRSPQFAVVGASKDEEKYGTRVLKWYISRGKTVTPVHPKEAELQGLATLKEIGQLPDPQHTSISIVTPPKVTLGILQKAKELGVPAIWIQPGAEDDAVKEYITEAGLTDIVVLGGPCVIGMGDKVVASLA